MMRPQLVGVLIGVVCLQGLSSTILRAEPPEVIEAGGNRGSLILGCQLKYGVEDHRVPTTEVRLNHPGARIYYLFSNQDLAIWELELVNNFKKPIRVAEPGAGWLSTLRPEFVLAGSEEPLDVELDILETRQSQLVLYRDGNPLEEFALGEPKITAGPASVVTPHDRQERVYKEVRGRFPDWLNPRASLQVKVRVQFAEDFPGGVVKVGFHDRRNDERCHTWQVIVLGNPATDTDIVDDHLVRYYYHLDQGLLSAAEFEVQEATRKVPSSLNAWTTRASFAARTEDWKDYLKSAAQLRDLLKDLDQVESYDRHRLLFARDMVRSIPEVRDRLQRDEGSGEIEEEP